MAKKQNNNTALIVGGLAALGLSVGGLALASNNAEIANSTNVSSQTESVINLPATNEKVNGIESRLETNVNSINAQINRRELENLEYINTLDDKQEKSIDELNDRILRLEQEIFDQVPPE